MIRGTVHDGTGRASQKMISKDKDLTLLGYKPYPGTLNVEVGPKARESLARLPSVWVVTDRVDSRYLPVTIHANGVVVDGHTGFNRGTRSLELLAPMRLRDHLRVSNGDTVGVQWRHVPIPRVLHQVWVGPPMPDNLRRWCDRWRELHPDWVYRLWTDADLGWLEHRDLFDAWPEHAPRNRGQWCANIARLEILYRHGGVYADMDMQPVRPIDDLTSSVRTGAFAVYQRPPGDMRQPLVSNALCGSYVGHSAVRSLMDDLRQNIRRREGLRCTHTTGVRYWTKHILERAKLTGHIDLMPPEVCFPYLPAHLSRVDPDSYVPPAEAYAVHHWHNQRSGGHVGRLR